MKLLIRSVSKVLIEVISSLKLNENSDASVITRTASKNANKGERKVWIDIIISILNKIIRKTREIILVDYRILFGKK